TQRSGGARRLLVATPADLLVCHRAAPLPPRRPVDQRQPFLPPSARDAVANAARAGLDSERMRPSTERPSSTPVTRPPRIVIRPCAAFGPAISTIAAPPSSTLPVTTTPGT